MSLDRLDFCRCHFAAALKSFPSITQKTLDKTLHGVMQKTLSLMSIQYLRTMCF